MPRHGERTRAHRREWREAPARLLRSPVGHRTHANPNPIACQDWTALDRAPEPQQARQRRGHRRDRELPTAEGLSVAAVMLMVRAILRDEQVVLPIAKLSGLFGIDGVYVGVPARLGRGGSPRSSLPTSTRPRLPPCARLPRVRTGRRSARARPDAQSRLSWARRRVSCAGARSRWSKPFADACCRCCSNTRREEHRRCGMSRTGRLRIPRGRG